MDDLFYFTTQAVAFRNVEDIALALGWSHILRAHDALEIGYENDASAICQWTIFDIGDAEPTEAAELRADNISTGFCVSHHRHNQALLILLEELLVMYGGWVGSDSDGFHPRFTGKNIRELWLSRE
jgi:hypothetical protein